MRVSVRPAAALRPEHLAVWRGVVSAVPSLWSPYFAPEFTLAAAEAREGVEVAVLEDGGVPVGFFPFQRGRGAVAHPVADPMSDFHGVIVRPEASWDGEELVRACGLRAWRFDHLIVEQAPLARFQWSTAPSPFVDLTGGFDALRSRHRALGSKHLEDLAYQERRASRAAGAARFELHTDSDEVFEALLRWKRKRYRDTGVPDPTASAWVVRLLDRVRRARGPAFEGVLSALYLGDRLAAVHLGMRTPTVFHYWLPAYDRELAALSPGNVCLLALLRSAAASGIARFDLGRGDEPYKQRLASGSTAVAQGAIDFRPLARTLAHGFHRVRGWARRSPLRRTLLAPARFARRVHAAWHRD
jgi:CelD/BcsL family acetyltransferase involved in cellulose biosynthesis